MSDKEHNWIPRLKQYLADGQISRREFIRNSTLLGLSAGAAYMWAGKITGQPIAPPARAQSMPRGGTLRIGVFWLTLAAFGFAQAEEARIAALFGLLAFTSIWAGFLIAGNHFGYWYCHEGAQNTHFQLSIWGTAAMIFLVAAA